MFLTISATADGGPLVDVSDLGYLLYKHPGRARRFDLSVGREHVFYPESGPSRCTAAR